MPSNRFLQFQENIARARSLVGLGQSIAGMTYNQVDASDLYRSAYVQGVAALDAYVHGVVLDYSVDIILGRRSPGSDGKLGLPVGAIADILGSPNPIDQEIVARMHVQARISRETYQKPDDIANAFALIGIPRIWVTVFDVAAGAEKKALGIVVTRRNQIVHACDADPSTPGQVTPVTDSDAAAAVARVERVVVAIDAVI